MGETGSGNLEFVIKTELEDACLIPSTVPGTVYPNDDTVVAYVSNLTELKNGTVQFSIDGWKNVTVLEMEIVNERTCRTVIPGQDAGTLVSYTVEAVDVLENVLVACGDYSVKHFSTLNLSSTHDTVYLGENVTVVGLLTPGVENISVTVCFTSTNASKRVICRTLENGTFTASFKSESVGAWMVVAEFSGDRWRYECSSSQLTVRVEEQPLLMKYSVYIGGGIGVIALISVIVYVKKSRG